MSLLERPYTLYVQKEADSFHFGTKFFVQAAEAAGKAGRKQQKTSLRNSSSSREVLSRLSWSFFCMRACAGERAAVSLSQGGIARFPQLKEINGLFAFLLHFADKTVVDFNLLGAGVAFVFYGFMDDNLLDQGIQQFGSQF